MKNKGKYYIVVVNDEEYIYFGTNNLLYKSDEIISDILHLAEKCTDEEIITHMSKKYGTAEIYDYLNLFNETECASINNKNTDNKISSLVLNVSHDCNLNCVYCYGDGGNYGLVRKLMDVDMAKKAIDYWLERLDMDAHMLTVSFFGGEPLMNTKVISFAVDYINERLAKLHKRAFYTITTNGTILNESILKLLIENQFNITVSIDGLKDYHDANRPFRDGKGSYSRVQENVKILVENGATLNSRITLTHENIKAFSDIVKSIWSLGIDSVVFDIATTTNQKYAITPEDVKLLEEQISELADITYDSLVNKGNRVLFNIVQTSMILNGNKSQCSCSFNTNKTLMMDPDGDVYRCHRVQGYDEFKLGNITDKLQPAEKVKFECCDSCWADKLCSKCAHTNYIVNNDVRKPYSIWCACKKILYKETLKLYIRLLNENPDVFREIFYQKANSREIV